MTFTIAALALAALFAHVKANAPFEQVKARNEAIGTVGDDN